MLVNVRVLVLSVVSRIMTVDLAIRLLIDLFSILWLLRSIVVFNEDIKRQSKNMPMVLTAIVEKIAAAEVHGTC